jgi:nitrous oxidase accessory protein
MFHHNNFTGNSFDVGTNGTLVLNKFENNYWDKYEGYDMNKDGIGDIPYHPVSMYSMIVEQNPTTLILFRSFMVSLLDKAEPFPADPENLSTPTKNENAFLMIHIEGVYKNSAGCKYGNISPVLPPVR